jgi:hypothetical protein
MLLVVLQHMFDCLFATDMAALVLVLRVTCGAMTSAFMFVGTPGQHGGHGGLVLHIWCGVACV